MSSMASLGQIERARRDFMPRRSRNIVQMRKAMNKATIKRFRFGEIMGFEEAIVERLTNEANRPRLHRGAEQSRGSEKLRESGRQCRRGPS